MSDAAAATLVVGGGGLLGSALRRQLRRDGREALHPRVTWSEPSAAIQTTVAAAAELLSGRRPWRIAWCAGAGVVGTRQEDLDLELAVLGGFVDGLRRLLRAPHPPGVVFLASSAGGVYAGSSPAPFSEDSDPVPLAPYGRAKLAGEKLVPPLGEDWGVSVLIGRLSNLYGPGQDITKPQGLVSQLCRAQLTRKPLSIYVPLDTARDYLYVDDAARMVLGALDDLEEHPGRVAIKIFCSHRSTSVGAILAEIGRVSRRHPAIVLGSSPYARFQAQDLRFRSSVLPAVDRLARTTLADGIAATLRSLVSELQAGRLASR